MEFEDLYRQKFLNPNYFIAKQWNEKYGGLNRVQIAEIFIAENPDMFAEEADPESFLRGFDRWIERRYTDKKS